MKLLAFRIKNFKSIADTGWKQLSGDGITALIGQNEAGKSAVLEALHCFDKCQLNEDFIRDDNYPEISCRFEMTGDDHEALKLSFADGDKVIDHISGNTSGIILTRTWTGLNDTSSHLDIENTAAKDMIKELRDKDEAELTPTEPAPPAPTPTEPETTPTPPVATPEAEETEEGDDTKVEGITVETLVEELYGRTPNIDLFVDFDSLLPPMIDLTEIDDAESTFKGRKGALNYLKVIGMTSKELSQPQGRGIAKKIRAANTGLTLEFQKFWRQFIGKDNKISIEFELKNHDDSDVALAGKPYIIFWIKDGQELLHPAQRSKGVQWFLSFYLQLQASKKANRPDDILLIDEPAAFLHAKAQADVLKVFEDTKSFLQILYTTHSPYLIDVNSFYRLIAVQRDDAEDANSETCLYEIKELGAASRETLSPVYTTIGVSLDHQQAIKTKNNVILEEPSAFYYLKAFQLLIGEKHAMHFLAATGVSNVPLLVSLFLGWDLDFVVVTDDDNAGKVVRRSLKKDLFGGDNELSKNKLIGVKDCEGIEDIFSPNDFKKLVLEDTKVSFTASNSKYLLQEKKQKLVLAVSFYKKVVDKKITAANLTQQSQKSVKELMAEIVRCLDS